MIKLQAKLR